MSKGLSSRIANSIFTYHINENQMRRIMTLTKPKTSGEKRK